MRSDEHPASATKLRTLHYGPRRPSLVDGLGRSGIALAAGVALLDALRASLKFFVSAPLAEALPAFAESFGFSLLTASALVVAVVAARNLAVRHRLPRHVTVYASVAVVVTGTLMVWETTQAWIDTGALSMPDRDVLLWALASDAARYVLLGALIASTWLYLVATNERAAETKRIAIESASMAEQVAEARLRMLEAQIEPHFLFNTLAHVRRLYDINPASGASMLASLRTYLGVALPHMREPESTLARELAHVRAYLEIQQIRMGRRLAWAIDVPAAIEDASIPPLMLLTLVENAVKHGLTPVRDGGRIDVVVRRAANRLEVRVLDTGRGFAASAGAGTGLANIRSRLRSRFGEAATLALAPNAPTGVVATLALPYVFHAPVAITA